MIYILAPFLFWLFICACGVAPLILLRFANFEPVENPIPIFDRSLGVLDPVWLEQTGFQGVSAIRPIGVPIAAFQNRIKTISMVVYFAGGQRVVDFVSIFPGRVGITTSTTIDGPVAPQPAGVIFQSFPNTDPDQLYRIHVQGVAYLQGQLQSRTIEQSEAHIQMRDSVVRLVDNLIRRPWVILSIPYRYAYVRFARKNMTVQQQVEKRVLNIDSLREQVQQR